MIDYLESASQPGCNLIYLAVCLRLLRTLEPVVSFLIIFTRISKSCPVEPKFYLK